VLDADGVLIDGRNRLEACRRAGVEPTFTVLDGQGPVAFILSSDVERRHLTKGARAMATVTAKLNMGFNFDYGWQIQLAREQEQRGMFREMFGQAYVVMQHAPDLVAQVMAGGSLNDAYAIALERKRAPEREEQRRAAITWPPAGST
jgi:hypothetical protein